MFNPRVGQKFTYAEGGEKFTGTFLKLDKLNNYFIVKWDHSTMNGSYSFTDFRLIVNIKLVTKLKQKNLPEWF
jgi:hypothetical protein